MQALRKEPLTVYGDGKQTRSFQYVSDLVRKLSPSLSHARHMSVYSQATCLPAGSPYRVCLFPFITS